MVEERLYLIDTFSFIFSVSPEAIREASPFSLEVLHG